MRSMPAAVKPNGCTTLKFLANVARKAWLRDVVNRGVAVYKGRVYVGTLDGRLVALDARNRLRGMGC